MSDMRQECEDLVRRIESIAEACQRTSRRLEARVEELGPFRRSQLDISFMNAMAKLQNQTYILTKILDGSE